MGIPGKGFPGKQLIIQGLGESSVEAGNIQVVLSGVICYASITPVRIKTPVALGHGVHRQPLAIGAIKEVRVHLTGVSIESSVGQVTIRTSAAIQLKSVASVFNVQKLGIQTGITVSVGSILSEVRISEVIASLPICVRAAGEIMASRTSQTTVKTVDRRIIEDQEWLEILLAA